jgi:tetratricopeptide (TPR) repeat protein
MRLRIGSVILFGILANPLLAGQSKDMNRVMASLPGKEWSVTMDLKGFTIDSNGLQSDGRYYLRSHADPGFAFSIYLEKVQGSADNAGCRDSLSQRADTAKAMAEDIQQSESGPMELLQYMIVEFKGATVHQKNVFGCISREDVYVDVHASKILYKPEDEPRLLALLQSVHFVENSGLSLQDEDMKAGSKYYLEGNYSKAIQQYEKVLQQENANPKLNKTTWRVLVDNLGMAYGVTGDLKHAKTTFEYGVSKDPTYPLFYYNLACTYGEMGDLKATTDYLTQAFKYRDNTIPGENMPDPREDSSFQRFMKDKEFKAFLDSLLAPAK